MAFVGSNWGQDAKFIYFIRFNDLGPIRNSEASFEILDRDS